MFSKYPFAFLILAALVGTWALVFALHLGNVPNTGTPQTRGKTYKVQQPSVSAVASATVFLNPFAEYSRNATVSRQSQPTVHGEGSNSPLYVEYQTERAKAIQGDAEAAYKTAVILRQCAGIPAPDTLPVLKTLPDSEIQTEQACFGIPSQASEDLHKWYGMAAEQHNPDAEYALSAMFPLGSSDNIRWLQAAVQDGSTDAQVDLGRAYFENGDKLSAYRVLKEASIKTPSAQAYLDTLRGTLTASEIQALGQESP